MLKAVKKELRLQLLNYKGINSLCLLVPIAIVLTIGFGSIFALGSAMMILTNTGTLQVEEKQKSHMLFLSCGITRKEYIISKFLGLFITSILGCLIAFIMEKVVILLGLPVPSSNIRLSMVIVTILMIASCIGYFIYYSIGGKIFATANLTIGCGILGFFYSASSKHDSFINELLLDLTSIVSVPMLVLIIIGIILLLMCGTVIVYERKSF